MIPKIDPNYLELFQKCELSSLRKKIIFKKLFGGDEMEELTIGDLDTIKDYAYAMQELCYGARLTEGKCQKELLELTNKIRYILTGKD